jgi:hypothetical protein
MIRTARTIAVIGIKILNAARPNEGRRAKRICSDPYADEEIQSEERMPSANFLLNRWCESEWRLSGSPRKAFLIR